MKPTIDIRNRCDSLSLPVCRRRVFPKTDFDCQATTQADLGNRCADCCRSSFRAISQNYFANEAPQHFVHEAVLFFLMLMTVALPLFNASTAVLDLIRTG
jgi:hypothetical protein